MQCLFLAVCVMSFISIQGICIGEHAHAHSEEHQLEVDAHSTDHTGHSDSEEQHCVVHCSSCSHVLIRTDNDSLVSGSHLASEQALRFKSQLYQDPTLSFPIRPPKYNA